MNKAQLVTAVVKAMEGRGLRTSENSASVHLGAILDVIKEELKEPGGSVSLVGFGTFSTRDIPAREYRNPQNGETVQKQATRVAKAKLSKNFLN